MATLFDQIWLGIQVTFEITFILYVFLMAWGIYRFIPKMAATLVVSIPSLLADGLKDTLTSAFSTFTLKQKMTELGEKGNQVKAERAFIVQQIAQTDPVKAFVLPWLEQSINSSDSPVPKYLRGTVNDIAKKMLQQTPINFTEQLVPRIIDIVDKRLPQLQLSERLKELDQLQKVEKVVE